MNGHAQAALEAQEGAARAREDFAAGTTTNPFARSDGTGNRHAAWNRQTQLLIHRRDCDQTVCCQEHDRHLAGHAGRYQWGLSSCSVCEAKVDEARAVARYNEPHDHAAWLCICWAIDGYAQRTCRGTCHLEGSTSSRAGGSDA